MLVRLKTFVADTNLLYLIQQVSGESSEEILSYFYKTAVGIADDWVQYCTTHNKKVDHFYKEFMFRYKETSVPFKLSLWRSPNNPAIVEIVSQLKFPQKPEKLDLYSVLDTMVEKALGLEGANSLKQFNAPRIKIPRGFKGHPR